MTEHDCDLCDSPNRLSLEHVVRPYIGDEQAPVVCADCGFVYVRQRRSPEEIAQAWDGIWGEGYTSAWPAIKARLTYVAEWIDDTIGLDGKSVIDIGAGEGTFLELVRAKGAHPLGIEPFAGNVQQIRNKGMACYHGTAESANPGKHDIATLLWTLENTGDCIGVLRRARKFVHPDGWVVVATGSRILVPYKKPLSSYFSKNPADTHCFRFSPSTLEAAFLKAGIGPKACNRFADSDWLLVAAQGPAPEVCFLAEERAGSVISFFEEWAKAFP